MKAKFVESLPEGARLSRRESALAGVVRMAKAGRPKFVEVTAPRDELVRLYKAAIQYRLRHPDEAINLRKHGDAFYVWIGDANPEDREAAESQRKPRRNSRVVMAPKAPPALDGPKTTVRDVGLGSSPSRD